VTVIGESYTRMREQKMAALKLAEAAAAERDEALKLADYEKRQCAEAKTRYAEALEAYHKAEAERDEAQGANILNKNALRLALADPYRLLLADLRINYEKSPWCRARGVHGWLYRLVSESAEALLTLEKDDPSCSKPDPMDLKKELGDVIWCALTTVLAAEDEGLFTLEEVLTGAREKLRRRKPWIFDPAQGQPTTPAEEHAMTLANKAKEHP
jgi:tetrapyrrole methylase family protein/MazG family protein